MVSSIWGKSAEVRKERASIITKSNDEDGVALVIESALEARP